MTQTAAQKKAAKARSKDTDAIEQVEVEASATASDKPIKASEKPFETRTIDGLRLILSTVEDVPEMLGKLDRIQGDLAKLTDDIGELVAALPEPIKYCPRWVDGDGIERCPGGFKLMKSQKAKGNPKAKEWMHPLHEEDFYEYRLETGAVGTGKWHNVYNSQALEEPLGGVEMPWPKAEGEHDAGNYGAPDESDFTEDDEDHLPF